MRIYSNMSTALSEVKRDLAEMGVRCHPNTMQDKDVHGNKDYETVELTGYSYMIDHPQIDGVMKCVAHHKLDIYVIQEFMERICGEGLNPGTSWEKRPEVWKEFLQSNGKFAYTYSERMRQVLPRTIEVLKANRDTRQGVVPIYTRALDDYRRGGIARVPCSMHYQFIPRNGELHMVYVMRSCDAATHLIVDMALAIMLMDHVADELEMTAGNFTHQIGSLHMYRKDTTGIF